MVGSVESAIGASRRTAPAQRRIVGTRAWVWGLRGGIARQGAEAWPPRLRSSDGGNPLHRSIARRAALAVVGLLALAPAAQAATSTSRTTLTNSTPDWATPNAQVGSVPDSAQHTFWVYLSMRNSKALDAAIAAVSNPASAGYGKYLTPDQFRARYAPTDADVAAVRAYLKQAGFAVSADRPDNNRWVKASGTTAQVEQAFKHAAAHLPAPRQDAAGAQRRPEHRALDLEPHRGHRRPGRQRPAHEARHRRRASRAGVRQRAAVLDLVGARRSPSTTRATRRSRPPTASSSCRTRRAATRRTSCRAPTAPRQPSPAASTATARRWRSSTPSPRRPSRRTPTSTRRPHGQPPVDFSQIKPGRPLQRPDRRTRPVRRAGLVRRGDPRRRGRARDGARRARPLRGRRRLPRRVAHRRGQQDRRRQPGPDRLELLRQPRRDRRGRRPAPGLERHLPPGRPGGHRDVLLLGRQRRRGRQPRVTPRRTSRPRTRSSPPSAAPRWA